MPSHVVFDLDGVLLDSAQVIRECYREALDDLALHYVHVPEDVLALEMVPWLVDRVGPRAALLVKERKNQLYLDRLATGRVPTLPPYVAALRLADDGVRVTIFTGAPTGTIDTLSEVSGWRSLLLDGHDGVTTPVRMTLLAAMASTGVYVDDQRRLVKVPPGWRFVWYSNQELGRLLDQILEEEP